jgi:hypothetical protein
MTDDTEMTRPYINEHGTLVMLTDAQYAAKYKEAGYRRLKAGEPIPIQQAEVDEAREAGKLMDLPGFEAEAIAEPPKAKDVKSLRRERAREDGAEG